MELLLLLRTIHTLAACSWVGGHFYWDTFVVRAVESKADWRTKANFIRAVNQHGILRWFLFLRWTVFLTGALMIWWYGLWNKWVLFGTLIILISPFWPIIPVIGAHARRGAVVKVYTEIAGSLEADVDPHHPRIHELEIAYKRWGSASAVHSLLGFLALLFMMFSAHGPAWFW